MKLIPQVVTWSGIGILALAALEDIQFHRVRRRWETGLCLCGVLRMCVTEESRWATWSLTCVCFFMWYVLYLVAKKKEYQFGGADVRLMTYAIPALGVSTALPGIWLGCIGACGVLIFHGKHKREIPLVPWIAGGCFLMELLQKIIYFL